MMSVSDKRPLWWLRTHSMKHYPSQMTHPDSNLTPIDYTGCSGYDGITVLELLFDKLVQKALAYVY